MLSNWQDAVYDEAVKRGLDPVIALATIEAETGGRNVLGDSGRAFGFGQVWLKWDSHYNALKRVANEMGIKIPSKPKTEQEEQQFKSLILNNDMLSLGMAIEVIKDKYIASGKDYTKFVKMYVGQGIPEANLKNRIALRDKWSKTDLSVYANGGLETKNIAVQVPKNANEIMVAAAVIAAGLAMLKVLTK
jgi:hypothetical protein